jgi:hypothetical protein
MVASVLLDVAGWTGSGIEAETHINLDVAILSPAIALTEDDVPNVDVTSGVWGQCGSVTGRRVVVNR